MGPYKDEDWLKRAYYEEGRALSDIADEFGVTIEAVRYYMKKYDLPRRRRGAREGEENPSWKGGPQAVTCENCGDEFETTHWKAKNDLATYCSTGCKHEHFTERYAGEGNSQYGVRGEENSTHGRTGPDAPNWQGGSRWRGTMKWLRARADALERDEGECVYCGVSNEEHNERYDHGLHCHHIEPVSDGGAKFDLDNLETICANCHTEQHNGKPFTQLDPRHSAADQPDDSGGG